MRSHNDLLEWIRLLPLSCSLSSVSSFTCRKILTNASWTKIILHHLDHYNTPPPPLQKKLKGCPLPHCSREQFLFLDLFLALFSHDLNFPFLLSAVFFTSCSCFLLSSICSLPLLSFLLSNILESSISHRLRFLDHHTRHIIAFDSLKVTPPSA